MLHEDFKLHRAGSIMRVLVTGKNGQVGWELQRTAPRDIEIHSFDSKQLDITDARVVDERVRAVKPDVIINCAAYTAVDKAEQERELAFAVNAEGAANVARAAAKYGARLIHISTDFVFDGKKSTPYLSDDVPNPLGVYGASKLAGEKIVRQELGAKALIIRTAWVYSAHGHNFVTTMLRLMREKSEIRVVADQIGTPTWAKSFAEVLWKVVAIPGMKGIFHWTDAGVASWYDFTIAIQEEARAMNLLDKAIPVKPIRTAAYPTPAQRPSFSVLDKDALWRELSLSPVHWCVALRSALKDFPQL